MSSQQNRVFSLIKAIRPKQWAKNGAIFVALVFSQHLFEWNFVGLSLGGFVVFCLLSGCIYLINDIVDLDKDRKHPLKCKRPLAAGEITVAQSWLAAALLLLLALGGAFVLQPALGWVTVGYFLMQIAYSFVLKHVVIIDTFCIAVSFFLRVMAGAYVINVEVSSWLLVCTFFVSLFIALSKRRHELVLLDDEAKEHRKVLKKYDILLLDQMISVVTAATVVCYSVYTLSEDTVQHFGSDNLKYTIPFVLYGIYRYLYLVYRKQQGGSPEIILLTDPATLINLILYVITVGIVIY